MSDNLEKHRRWAVQRFINGEKATSICASLGRSASWLYKWVRRYVDGDYCWSQNRSRRPSQNPRQIPSEVEQVVKMIRLNLYNRALFCGAQAILWEMQDMGVTPLPSIRTINRILSRNGLTHRRTGIYVPKGRTYPKLPALMPN